MAWTKQNLKEDWAIEAKILNYEKIQEMEARRTEERVRRASETGLSALSCTPFAFVKQQGINLEVCHVFCKNWRCERCGPKRTKRLKWEARKGNPKRFITLTSNPEVESDPDQRARSLVRAWREIRRRYRRVNDTGKMEFMAVFEKTKKGEPHLHILTKGGFIRQSWLSKQMDSLTGSPIVDIRRIKNKRHAASYVSKYVAKNPQRFEGTKRYWRSLDYFPKPNQTGEKEEIVPSTWYFIGAKPTRIVPALIAKGFKLFELAGKVQMVWYGTGPPPLISAYV